MFKTVVCLCLLGALVSVAWSDEPVPPRTAAAVKQRVDPKLLKEALALPEFQGPAADSPAALLEDLQKLANKLKTNGDIEASDLLQKFIDEHQRLVKQLQHRAISFHDHHYLMLKVVEVNLDRLPADSILRKDSMFIAGKTTVEASKIYLQELERMIENKLARALIEPALRVRSDGHAVHTRPDEFPIPIAHGTVSLEFREFGISIEALPTSISEQKVRLQSTCQFRLNGRGAGFDSNKVQTLFELNPGEPAVQCSVTSQDCHDKWFVVYQFLPKT